MKIHELIERLRKCDQDAQVLVWAEGLRHPISEDFPVDPWGEGFVDLNIVTIVSVDKAGEARYLGPREAAA